ncbi:hypothetical protein GDO86_003252 [Hymenochirus boettgeri]|uniref:Laminin subunit beta-3 n=1 Tax=Hymenochirus boettgeri TaxID=247094 RepID=A0A8T2K3C0_9PIPI|nr:hypothetical protein GDO86_003252 [Hymenochirus boettgeri]
MWIYASFLVLPSLLYAQNDCSRGACYPPVGDLLIGRSNYLRASSTCGLEKPETYCSPYGEMQMKCCRCDSRQPFTEISHRITNVLSPTGNLRWWQSSNGIDTVSLQFDLNRKFQLRDFVLDFRSPRPASMLVERSSDFGKTWHVYQYLAYDCAASFPHISQGQPHNLQDVRCQKLHGDPTQGGKIQFSPMEMDFLVPASHSQRIQHLAEFTNLRINFTQLTRLPPRRYREPSAFYAVDMMQIHGSCLCNGHADRCVQSSNLERDQYGDIQVYDACVCQHNTVGTYCELCADLFNDLPWRPADVHNPNECKRCNCNNHADKCHFDPAVYEASGRVSGGVCEDCRDGTTGRSCERCRPDYYRNPNRDRNHRDACISCDCDPEGSVPTRSCDELTGRCNCKENVGGERCDQCKPGYYLLSASNPLGCTKCMCNLQGTQKEQPCGSETGQCRCLPNVVGRQCEQCTAHHWNIGSGRGCERCGCHPRNSYSLQCNQVTGHCQCREGFGGKLCTECPDGMYGNLQTGCRACNCDTQGTLEQRCDKASGKCLCRPGIVGDRCDSCQRGYSNHFPVCRACHQCFHFYDYEINVLGSHVRWLQNTSSVHGGETDLGLGPRIVGVDAGIQRIQRISIGTVIADSDLLRAEGQLSRMRGEARQLNTDLPDPESFGSLSTNMNSLQAQFNKVNVLYQRKKEEQRNSIGSDAAGIFNAVNSAYQSSLESAKRVAAAEGVVSESRDKRKVAQGLEGSSGELLTDLETLKEALSYPNLTPTINRICEGVRTDMCTPDKCPGFVCQRNNTLCTVGSPCRGAFPLSRTALKNTEKTSQDLQNFNRQLQKNMLMIKEAEKAANQIQDNAQQLTEQVSRAKARMEEDLGHSRQFIQQVRNFLAEIETELQEGRKTLLDKFSQIDGLEEEASNIRDYISRRAYEYATCK